MNNENSCEPEKSISDWTQDNWGEWEDIEENNISENSYVAQKKHVSPPKAEPTTTTTSWANKFLRPFGGVVSTITTTVSHGINQVISGVTDPEDMARLNAEEAKLKHSRIVYDESKEEEEVKEGNEVFGIGLVSGVLENIGTKVINTSLDTLEGIGKKTMQVLQENDPLLINKRKLLGLEPDNPNLSAILKEAKDDADQWENTFKKLQIEKAKNVHFESLFENYCGLVHLEALNILSKESTFKLQKLFESVSGQALRELQETVNEVKELMELEELEGESEGDYTEEELNKLLTNAIEDADLKINFDDIVNIWSKNLAWLNETTDRAAEEIFTRGITTLAETCALEMNKLHKIAELLLIKEHHSTANEVDGIVQLCKQFYIHLSGLTNRFATKLTVANDTDEAKNLTSNLFTEMLQAAQHIEKAFKLFLPIIQIGAA